MSFNEFNSLPDGWRMLTVNDLVNEGILDKPLDGNHGGIHPKSTDYVEQGVPFIMASDLEGGQVNFAGCKFISEDQANSLRKGFAKTGDILISHKATIGRTAIVQKSKYPFLVLTPQVTYYRVKNTDKLIPQYLKSYFDSCFFQDILNQWSGSGSTRAYIGITEQLKLPIILPPINYQVTLSGHAAALDNKIQLNHQINQTLEQMAQALFKSWFVDFEPVKAKIAALAAGGSPADAEHAAMLAICGKDDAYLARTRSEDPERYDELRATAALFPAAMQESELGDIPVGWEVGMLSDLANLNSRSWTKRTIPPEIEYVDLANTKNGIIESVTKYHADEAPSRAKRVLSEGDTIVGTVRPGNRSFAFIKRPTDVLVGSTGFAVLSPKNKFFSEFIYIAATSEESIEYLAHLADGGAYPAVRPDVVAGIKTVIPPIDVAECFHKIAYPYFEKFAVFRAESQSLAQIRDTLLPKLLSGEISVSEAEDTLAATPTEAV